VIVKPDRRAPTAVHMLWVRVGAMDEVDGTSGVAHVLEHMMFKGTPELGPASSRAGSRRWAGARTRSPRAITPATSSRSRPAGWRT
jgi:predicted Zn-dependent peptidase